MQLAGSGSRSAWRAGIYACSLGGTSMKLAFTTLACPDWSLEQAADAARRYGYEGLELRLLDGNLIGPDLGQAARERVRRVSAESGLPIVCLDTSVRIAQPDPAARDQQIRDGL